MKESCLLFFIFIGLVIDVRFRVRYNVHKEVM